MDLRLLDLLQQDCVATNQRWPRLAMVSPATALRRVKALVEAGVIERQVAVLNPDAVGAGLIALVEVTLDRQGADWLDAFEAHALPFDEVQQCYRVSPGPDFMLVLQVRDMAAYAELAQRLFTSQANVRNVKAFFSVRRAQVPNAAGIAVGRQLIKVGSLTRHSSRCCGSAPRCAPKNRSADRPGIGQWPPSAPPRRRARAPTSWAGSHALLEPPGHRS